MKFVLALALSISSFAYAEGSLHSHEHGSLDLDIAVEGKNIEVTVDGPAESFLGFEYVPKSIKDKKILTDATNLWVKDFLKLLTLESKLGCKLISSNFEQKKDEKEGGNHSDVEANAKITCSADLSGKKASVNLRKYFKHIKKLKVELVGSQTKSIDITKDQQEIQL